MELNPYESPRPGERAEERVPNGATSVLQLLTEIRDGQRDLVELQRQMLASQQQWHKGFNRFRPTVAIPLLVVVGLSFLLRWYFFPMPIRPPFTPPVPARVTPAPPRTTPTASLHEPGTP